MRRITSPFHTVIPSPYPFLISMSAFTSALGAILYFRKGIWIFLLLGLINIIIIFTLWCRDVIREATYQGCHTLLVSQAHRLAFILFIGSEGAFFFSFFWAYFYSALSPSIEIGVTWPPVGISPISPWGFPLFNTTLLIVSGISITIAHHNLIGVNISEVLKWTNITYLLGLLFSFIQFIEYRNCSFSIAEGIYGSCFYMLTGFHGLHVIIGTIFLIVCYYRTNASHFTQGRHVGFECCIWYWHFVDVIWILLYISVYIWGR